MIYYLQYLYIYTCSLSVNFVPMIKAILIILVLTSGLSVRPEKSGYRQKKDPIDQKDIVARLTGYTYIADSIKLSDRYTSENKQYCVKYLTSLLNNFCSKVSVQAYSKTGTNISGLIPSTTGSDEYVIFGAHFDGIPKSPAANDNATGVAVVSSVGKYISELRKRKYNTLIVFFDEEERGLLGSRAFAAKIKADSLKVISVHTIDQMGWDNDGDRAIELEQPSENLKEIYLRVASDNKLNFPIHITKEGGTDHSAFRRQGYNAIGITEEYVNGDTTPHFHKSTDSYSTVNFEYMKSTTMYLEKVFQTILKQ